MDRFVGYDYANNPITEQYYFHGDSRYTARSEEAADMSNWNMMLYQNQYNSPTEQLKRLEDAGLNPLYYLGQNAGTTPAASGGSAQGHSMSSKNGSLENILQAVNTVNQAADTGVAFRKQMLEYDVAKEANAINKQNADTQRMLVQAQVPLMQSQQDYYDYGLTPKTEREIAQINQNIENLKSQKVLTDEQAKQATQNTQYLAALEGYYKQMQAVAGSQAALNYSMARYYGSQEAYTNLIAEPMADKLVQEAGMTKEQARKFSIDATNAIYSGNILQFQARMLNKYGEAQQVGQLLDIFTKSAEQGMNALNTGVNTFFNISSGGLYGAFGNKAQYQGFHFGSFGNPSLGGK